MQAQRLNSRLEVLQAALGEHAVSQPARIWIFCLLGSAFTSAPTHTPDVVQQLAMWPHERRAGCSLFFPRCSGGFCVIVLSR